MLKTFSLTPLGNENVFNLKKISIQLSNQMNIENAPSATATATTTVQHCVGLVFLHSHSQIVTENL
jgi:hypothetical protein